MNSTDKHRTNLKGSWRDRLIKLESSVCEGLQSDWQGMEPVNIFGRLVTNQNSENISYICGMAMSGLRTSAILNLEEFDNSLKQVRISCRQHLPLTIHIDKTGNGHFSRELLNPVILPISNAIQIVSSNTQEVLDFALIAHKVAEIAICPVINQICVTGNDNSNEMPQNQRIQFIGNPEDQIEPSTPAQKIIFGKNRRRIPNWFNYDYPALLNPKKDIRSLGMEYGANKVYFEEHLKGIISGSFKEFEKITGREHNFFTEYNSAKSPNLIITCGYNPELAKPIVDELGKNGIKTGFININVIYPFPESQLSELIVNKKTITVLEPLAQDPNWLISRIRTIADGLKNKIVILSGQYSGNLKISQILAAASNMASSKPKKSFFCDIEFTRSLSNYPKHQVLLQAIEREYPVLKERSLINEDPSSTSDHNLRGRSPSHIVERYKDLGAPFTQLSRFQDSSALFYENGNNKELVADPFKAIQSIPAASASIKTMTGLRESFPIVDPQKCTACGNCMIHCPYAAMPSLSIGIEKLISSGMELATESGIQIINLLPMVKNISKAAGKVINKLNNEDYSGKLTDILDPALNEVLERSKPEEEKLEFIKTEFRAVFEGLDTISLTLSDILYYKPESNQNGSGEFFFLTIDPNACTGCGLCATSCNDDAITMVPESQEIVDKAVKLLEIWEKLPDTSSDTINNLLFDSGYDSLAALMLSRNFYHSLTGGGNTLEDAPSRQLMHIIFTITESLIQPRYAEFIKEIEKLSGELSESIHSMLSESLPKENFDTIAKAIRTTDNKVPFDEIIRNISSEEKLSQVDTSSLKRKIELLNSLRALKWTLNEGPTGAGRSRMGINISSKDRYEWADQYPYNPFISPVLAFGNEFSFEVILGILKGQMRNIIDNLKLIRKARLEVRNKYVPKENDREIAGLDWNNISEEEKRRVPPLLLFTDQDMFSEQSSGSVSRILAEDQPVKIFVLDDMLSSPDSDSKDLARISEIISAIGLKRAFYYQGSPGSSQAFFDGILEGMNALSPSMFRIFSPKLENHSIEPQLWPSLGNLVCTSRALPNLKFNSDKYAGFLNSCISLENNYTPEKTWVKESIDFKDQGEDKTIKFDITWADWAFTINSWKSHFSLYDGKNGPAVHIAEFISNPSSDSVPVIYRIKDEQLIQYAVSEKVVEKTRLVKESWDLLREVSGELTEFPEKLTNQIKVDLQKKFDDELAIIKADFDIRLKQQEKVQVEELRKKLKDKLVQLTTTKK